MKRILAVLLAVLMLTLCGCSTVVLGGGTLNYDVNEVDHIRITNGLTYKTFSVADRETISTIINYINSYNLNSGFSANTEECLYTIRLVNRLAGGAEHFLTVVSEESVIHEGTQYIVNTKDFLQYLETLECDMLTDNELIDSLLDTDTLDRLNVLDADGKISLDKILSLPKTCPALFELLSRPSGITSIATYGIEKIEFYLKSNNPELVEKAEEWIQVIEKLVPEAREKITDLIEKYRITQDNP